jgi:hypothetical protein
VALRRALRPGGVAVVSLPNEWTLPRRLGAVFGRPGFGGHDDPHLRHFDPRSARRLFVDAGWCVLAHRWDGLAPPRWGIAKRVCDLLTAVSPGLFALSGVYLLEPRERAQERSHARP